MKVSFLNFIVRLLVYAILFLILNLLVIKFFFPDAVFFYNIFLVYSFLYVVTCSVYGFILYVNKSFSDYTAYAFVGGGLFKMALSVVFLTPILIGNFKFKINDFAVFFITYFFFMVFETIYVVKLLNQSSLVSKAN